MKEIVKNVNHFIDWKEPHDFIYFSPASNTAVAQSAGAAEYTDFTSVDSPTRVLDRTLNNLRVSFQ